MSTYCEWIRDKVNKNNIRVYHVFKMEIAVQLKNSYANYMTIYLYYKNIQF